MKNPAQKFKIGFFLCHTEKVIATIIVEQNKIIFLSIHICIIAEKLIQIAQN